MSIGQKIKEKRISLRLSQEDVAKAIGATKQAVYKYENGIVTNIPTDKIAKMASLFGTSPAYLMGWDGAYQCPDDENPFELELRDAFSKYDVSAQRVIASNLSNLARMGIRPISTKKLPMLGNVACGEPIFADESRESFVDVGNNIDADFCLTAKGDSMINARIFDGDILFVKSQDIVDDGEIAVVLIEDEATVKRVFYDRENDILTLVPENPTYKPMRYSGEQLDHIRILGKVVFGQYRI